MIYLWLNIDFWKDLNHPEGWAILIGGLLTAIGTVLAVMFAAFLTYRYTLKHSKIVHNANIQADILKRRIDALEQLWGLLGYMSFAESDTAIIRWREEQKGEKKYYVHIGNLRHFILTEVNQAIYQKHAGLHIAKDIRDAFFDYRGSLMGLYMRYQDEADDALIQIKKINLVDKYRDAYNQLNKAVKKELEACYKQQKL